MNINNININNCCLRWKGGGRDVGGLVRPATDKPFGNIHIRVSLADFYAYFSDEKRRVMDGLAFLMLCTSQRKPQPSFPVINRA